jgi:hypothetical protein
MINPVQLEEAFKEFSQDMHKWAPDGVISVDLQLLEQLGLLNNEKIDHSTADALTHFFHVIETVDKVTLFNEQFAIWIVPHNIDDNTSTVVYIALMQGNIPHLEIVFTTAGVYNTPKYILKILEHFLSEVLDTEAIISSIGKKTS